MTMKKKLVAQDSVLSWLDSHCFFPSQRYQRGYKAEKECDDQHFNNFIVDSKGFLST